MEVLYIFNSLSSKMPENGICLSGKVFVDVDFEEHVFKIRFRENQKGSDFYGDPRIASVSAYVGENGVGKTHYICGAIDEFFKLEHDFVGVCIYLDTNGELKIVRSSHFTAFRFRCNKPITETSEIDMFAFLPRELKTIKTLYFSNSINGSLRINNLTRDISTAGILREIVKKPSGYNKSRQRDFEDFKKSEIVKQIEFLDFLKSETKIKRFENTTSVVFKVSSSSFFTPYLSTGFIKELNAYLRAHSQELVKDLGIYEPVNNTSFCNVLFYALVRINKGREYKEQALDIFKEANFKENILKKIDDSNGSLKYSKIVELLKFVSVNEIRDIDIYSHNISEEAGQELYTLIFSIDKSLFIEFYYYLKGFLSSQIDEIEYDWPLSSGESAMLSLYARLFKNGYSGQKHLLVLLDEADAFYHPDWSRQLLDDLLTTVPQIIPLSSLQFIITAHSPFVLSDIPSQDVFRLEKKNDELIISQDLSNQTFAANIHSLLANSFFMKNGYIGEFAKSFIEKLIVRIDDLKKINEKQFDFKSELGEIQRGIELVGDRVIKLRLEQKLSEAIRGLGAETKSKVRLLKEKNDLERRLKKINKDLKDD